MRSDHHSGLRSIFGAKLQVHSRHCGHMSVFNISLGPFCKGIFILKTVTYVFHTCTMCTLQT